jgi:ribosome assembly protein YihI (activator of Der GTPase)
MKQIKKKRRIICLPSPKKKKRIICFEWEFTAKIEKKKEKRKSRLNGS